MSASDALYDLIIDWYLHGKLQWPTPEEAVIWAQTEMGEVFDLLLMQDPERWKRNNPGDHPIYTPELFAEELGDAIMMLLVAGLVAAVDPLQALTAKLERKLGRAK